MDEVDDDTVSAVEPDELALDVVLVVDALVVVVSVVDVRAPPDPPLPPVPGSAPSAQAKTDALATTVNGSKR
ncbi:MAG: hypothetical protein HOV80_15075 [Polyangiaceae bacterium]|nr:hypothetical protein [Polyangiaceae bacterium]